MIGRLSHRETVTDLLAGGTLTARSNMTLENISSDFSQVCYICFRSVVVSPILLKMSKKHFFHLQVLQRVCFYAHMTLVEQVDLTASLYSHSIQQHNVCLLLKFNVCMMDILSGLK